MNFRARSNIIFLIYIIILWGSIFQFYFINLYDSYFSLVFFFLLLLLPTFVFEIKILKIKIIFFIFLLIIILSASLLWSIDKKIGIKDILWYLMYIALFLNTLKLSINYTKQIRQSIDVYFVLLLIIPILVILFRFIPSIESLFIDSFISKIFINPNVLSQYMQGILSNISDPEKAGGFFTNANVAGTYLGINYFIVLGFFLAYRKIVYLFIGSILAIGVFCTGSKASALIFIIFNILLYLKTHKTKQLFIFLILAVTIVILIIFINLDFLMHYSEEVFSTADIRFLIWGFGIIGFLNHPILGLGYGGWTYNFQEYAKQFSIQVFPPHNTLIALWANSGILAVICGLIIMYHFLKFALKLQKSENKEIQGLGIAMFFSYSWVFLQGMGENFGLLGDEHMKVILAVLFGYSYARYLSYSKG